MLAGLALVLFLVGLGRPPLWEPDEGRYAEIAREMVTSHDYITPHNNFVRYFEKPPLVYWLTAASLKFFGPDEFAVRLQAAIASVGQVAITGALGEKMFGPTTGVIAGLVLALSPLFFAFARFATPDPALAFFITAALACFYSSFRWSDRSIDIGTNWMVGAAAMLGLGTLTKGPVALLLAGTIAILWLLQQGWQQVLFRVPWLRCGGVYLGFTLPWFIAVAQRNPGFLTFFIIHEHFQRYLESTEHSWGPWFYIPITIAGTWPWVYFVPFALLPGPIKRTSSWWPFRRNLKRPPESYVEAHGLNADSDGEHTGAALDFLVTWFAVVFIFFSIPRSKLGEYILPALPPIGILAAHGLMRIEKLATPTRRPVFLLFAAINLAAATAIVVFSTVVSFGSFSILSGDARVVAAALFAVAITSVLFAGCVTTIITALAMSVIVEIGAATNARERLAPLVSYRGLARIIAPYIHRGCKLMSYGHFEQALPFYTGEPEILVNYRGELQPFGPRVDSKDSVFASLRQLEKTWAGDQCVILVVNGLNLPTLANLLSPKPTLVGCEGKKAALYNRQVRVSGQDGRAPKGCKTP
ncbi:MAG: glycosyltransferase family 39 protein [Deltaproteobacteria bacterium]|nr:glycosyltransferase family 39 protein [Deltaproteobacteria bacterium]